MNFISEVKAQTCFFYLAVNLSASLLKQYFEKRYEHMFNRIVSRGLVQRCFLLICRLVNVIITWEFPSGYFVHYLNVLKVARCVTCLINEVQRIKFEIDPIKYSGFLPQFQYILGMSSVYKHSLLSNYYLTSVNTCMCMFIANCM